MFRGASGGDFGDEEQELVSPTTARLADSVARKAAASAAAGSCAGRAMRAIRQPVTHMQMMLYHAVLLACIITAFLYLQQMPPPPAPPAPPPPPPPPQAAVALPPPELNAARSWSKPSEAEWKQLWWHQSAELAYPFLSDAPSSISPKWMPFALSPHAQSLRPMPHLPDCRYYYGRAPAQQAKLEKRMRAEHAHSMQKRSPDGSKPAWLQTATEELSQALAAENNKWLAGIVRWLTPKLAATGFKPRPVPLSCTDHAVVMIESRSDPSVLFALRNTFFMLDSDSQRWGLILFHSDQNEAALVDALEIWPGGAGQHIVMYSISSVLADRNSGNKLILSSALWEAIPVENVLLLQNDAVMLKPAGADLSLWQQFTNQYVYVGAPFPHPDVSPFDRMNHIFLSLEFTPFGGNGGLSFRKKSAMVSMLRELVCDGVKVGHCRWQDRFPITTIDGEKDDTYDEDRWIGRELFRHSHKYRRQLAFPNVARKFSVDTIYDEDPFFVHKYWQLLDDHNIDTRDRIIELMAHAQNFYKHYNKNEQHN